MDIKKELKLHIIDSGDKASGIPESEYTIDCPFLYDADVQIRHHFATYQRLAFNSYAQGRLTYYYSDEIQEEEHEDI